MESVALSERETVEAVEGVHLTQLAAGERASVQHFHIEAGAVVPAHSHPQEQAGWITRGRLTFHLDGGDHVVRSGDSYSIPAGERHGATNEGEEAVRGVDVFAPPRPNPDWGE